MRDTLPEGRSADMLFAVLGVQLGYLSAEEALAAARELAQPTERRTLSEFLVSRGILDRARAQVLERLAAKATAVGGGDAAQTLELLPSSVRKLAAQSAEVGPRVDTRVDVVDEQAHRYFSAPRADAPPAELGRGHFARVSLMHDTVIGRDVAWRAPLESSSDADAQLLAEARMLAGFDHPAVVPIYEAGRGARGLYVTQRRVGSRTLAEAITAARSLDERLALLPALSTVAECIARAHERGLTHRGLTCSRVSLGRFGEVYVLGWGAPVETEAERADGVILDVRGLGAMLHEVVTGLPPPVMGTITTRGAPDDLLGLCRSALAGQGSSEQLAQELKAFIDGRRLGSYRYSSWQLLKRYVQRHRLFTAMAVTLFLVVTIGTAVVASRVAGERDRARLFARLFLDDVALRLRAQPGVEPLLERVTDAALQHYERTTELRTAPREERLRVARAMARLGTVSLSLGRRDEAQKSFDFASALVATFAPGDPDADLVLAEIALSRAEAPGALPTDVTARARDARARADHALERHPDSFEARRLSAVARVALARLSADDAEARGLFDDALARLQQPARDPADELLRRETLGQALVDRALRVHAPTDELESLLTRLTALRERALDDLELQVSAARAALLLAESLEGVDVERQHARAELAVQWAREASARRPDKVEFAVLVVRAELLAGRPVDALASARGFEARGFVEVAPLTSEAAFFSGQFEQARVLAARPEQAQVPRVMLVRALASAWLDRPSDAVIQLRALKGAFGDGVWPASRLASALEARPQGAGRGEATVRAFGERWKSAGGAEALSEFIAALEASLH